MTIIWEQMKRMQVMMRQEIAIAKSVLNLSEPGRNRLIIVLYLFKSRGIKGLILFSSDRALSSGITLFLVPVLHQNLCLRILMPSDYLGYLIPIEISIVVRISVERTYAGS